MQEFREVRAKLREEGKKQIIGLDLTKVFKKLCMQ